MLVFDADRCFREVCAGLGGNNIQKARCVQHGIYGIIGGAILAAADPAAREIRLVAISDEVECGRYPGPDFVTVERELVIAV